MVEVVVSLFLIVMVMGGAYRIIVQASRLSRAARNHYVAETLCKNRLERARNFEYADLILIAENGIAVNDNGYPTPSGWFKRTTVVNTNLTAGCTMVEVTVQIKNRKTGQFGTEQEKMSTLFTEYLIPPVP